MNAEEAAVAAVRAELAALGDPPVPDGYAARWAAALDAESSARAGRVGRHLRPAAVLLAAAALVVVAVVLWPGAATADRTGLASAGLAAVGSSDAGALADPARRAGCLRAVRAPGVDPDATLLGGRRVVVGGRHGVLLVLPSGRLGTFHVVVVDPDCGPGGGFLITHLTVGGR